MPGSPLKRARKEAERKAALATIQDQPPPPRLFEGGADQHWTPEKEMAVRVQVVAMAQVGCTLEQMAYLTGVHKQTLLNRFPDELKAAAVVANGLVAASMLRKAIDGDVRAQELWLRQHAGWFPQNGRGQGPDLPPEVARELEEARALRQQLEHQADDPHAGRRSLVLEFVKAKPEPDE